MDDCDLDAEHFERSFLVVHQRHDDGEAWQHLRGDLEHERLAGAGGKDCQDIAASQHCLKHILLTRAKAPMAEPGARERQNIFT